MGIRFRTAENRPVQCGIHPIFVIMSYRIGFSWRISMVGDADSEKTEALCQKDE